MNREELLSDRCIDAELALLRATFRDAGGNAMAINSMTVAEFVESCVRNNIYFYATYEGAGIE